MGLKNEDGGLDQEQDFIMSMNSSVLCSPDQFGLAPIDFLTF